MRMMRIKNRSIGVIDHEKANGDVFRLLQGDQDQVRVKHVPPKGHGIVLRTWNLAVGWYWPQETQYWGCLTSWRWPGPGQYTTGASKRSWGHSKDPKFLHTCVLAPLWLRGRVHTYLVTVIIPNSVWVSWIQRGISQTRYRILIMAVVQAMLYSHPVQFLPRKNRQLPTTQEPLSIFCALFLSLFVCHK